MQLAAEPLREGARDVVWMATANLRRLLYASPTFDAVVGRAAAEDEPPLFAAAQHTDDKERVARAAEDALARGDGLDVEYRIVRPDGAWRWIHDRAFPIRDAEGRTERYVGLAEDVTELKREQEELESVRRQMVQTERLSALGSLVSGLAHEIRTPLATATNHLALIRSRFNRAGAAGALSPELSDVPGHVAATLDQLERIDRLVQGLRRFAKMEPGRRERLGLDVVAADALLLFQSAHRGEVEVVSDLAPTTPVDLDKVQVVQLVLRLLENAADALRPGGRVRVATRETPMAVELVVEDAGEGIPRDALPHIFEEFFTTKPGRTGLGLSIARRIVESHGGAISCRSDVGRGTTFVVSFPLPR